MAFELSFSACFPCAYLAFVSASYDTIFLHALLLVRSSLGLLLDTEQQLYSQAYILLVAATTIWMSDSSYRASTYSCGSSDKFFLDFRMAEHLRPDDKWWSRVGKRCDNLLIAGASRNLFPPYERRNLHPIRPFP